VDINDEEMQRKKIINAYRSAADKIKSDILKKALKDTKKSNVDQERLIKKFADQLTNKLLHGVFKNIKANPKKKLEDCELCIPATGDRE
jgi:glutamyl-tRNA reductase